MSKRTRMHPVYAAFLIIMILMALCGLFLLIYGSTHHTPVPQPGAHSLLSVRALLCHG